MLANNKEKRGLTRKKRWQACSSDNVTTRTPKGGQKASLAHERFTHKRPIPLTWSSACGQSGRGCGADTALHLLLLCH